MTRIPRLDVITLVLAAALGLAACGGGSKSTGPSTGASTTPADFDFGSNDPHKVTAFGDSITAGVLEQKIRTLTLGTTRMVTSGLSTSNNYPNILQGMLRGLDPAWRVVNRGQSGERTGPGVGRFPGVLAADHPGYALIMEGTNDASEGDDPGFIAGNLERMVDAATGNHSIPVIGTIPPNFRHDPGAQAIIDDANTMIRAMARARGIQLAEIFNGMNDRSLFGQAEDRDPLHPNERGYEIMASIWFEALQRALPRATAAATPSGGQPATQVAQRTKRP